MSQIAWPIAIVGGAVVLFIATNWGFYGIGLKLGAARNQKRVDDYLQAEQGRIQRELTDGDKPKDADEALDRI